MAGKTELSNPNLDPAGDVSRRKMLTGSGIVAAGVGLAGAASSMPASAWEDDGLIGVAKPGVNAGEYIARIVQSGSLGETFASYGYVTKLAGATADDLFSGTPHNVSTALLTSYTEGKLLERVVEGSMRALDVVGTLTIYQRSAPGATFADPASFVVGTPVARFALRLQDVLAVFAPARGIPTLSGDMRQTESARFGGHGRRFGRVGMTARTSASGIGALTDPVTLNAVLEMAGNWTIEE